MNIDQFRKLKMSLKCHCSSFEYNLVTPYSSHSVRGFFNRKPYQEAKIYRHIHTHIHTQSYL